MDRRWKSALLSGVALLAVLATLLGLRRCSDLRPNPSTATVEAPPASTPATSASAPSALPAPPADPSLRMRSLVFRLDAQGVTLQEAASLAGRVKSLPRSVAEDRVEFVAFAADGRELFAGAFDHPLHRRFEFESAAQPGQLESVRSSVAANLFPLRLPAEPRAARVAFFEVRAGRTGRQTLGEVVLP